MSDNKGKKRNKKQYYRQSAKKGKWAHALDADMRGFLITCNNREREAVREAYNLFNEYADKLYGPEQKAEREEEKSGSEEEDIEAALEKEVSDLKTQKKSERRFQQVESGANNCIFIKTTLADPNELVNTIFTDVYESETAKSRYVMRLLPVIGTCKCNEDKIKKMAEDALKAHFTDAVGHSFSINVKVRNNNSMNRKQLIPLLIDVIKELNPANNPELDHPEYVVNVDIIRNLLCLSVLKDFVKFRKYNLQEVASAKSAAAKASTQKAEAKEEAPEKSAEPKSDVSENAENLKKDYNKEGESTDDVKGSAEVTENPESEEPNGSDVKEEAAVAMEVSSDIKNTEAGEIDGEEAVKDEKETTTKN